MNGTFFYIGLGAGLAARCGLRPVPAAAARRRARLAGALGVELRARPLTLPAERGWWLLAVAVALVLAYALQLLLGLAPTLDPAQSARGRDRSRPRWRASGSAPARCCSPARSPPTAMLPGPDCSAAWPRRRSASAPSRPVIAGARARLPDRAAREALTVYLDAASLLLAALVALLHPLGYVARRAVRLVLLAAARARGREVRRPAHPAPLMASLSSKPPKLVLCVIDAMAPAMLERAVAEGRAPVLGELMRARPLRARLRGRVPLGDAGVRRLDRHRRRPRTRT